jgi:hypothetical protein
MASAYSCRKKALSACLTIFPWADAASEIKRKRSAVSVLCLAIITTDEKVNLIRPAAGPFWKSFSLKFTLRWEAGKWICRLKERKKVLGAEGADCG